MHNARLSIDERIRQGPAYFQIDHFAKYTPEEGDILGLFFLLLLEQVPMERVQPVPGKNGVLQKPKNSEHSGFHRAFAPRWKTWLGPRPTCATYQKVTDTFLKKWCPTGGRNDFKWRDTSSPNGYWTLSHEEIEVIAYATTYKLACATMQYDAWRSATCKSDA